MQRRDVSALSARNWQEIEEVAAAHRLLPILHHRLADMAPCDLPPDLAERLQRSFARQRIRWLRQRAAMVRISAALEAAGIDHVYLKGAALCLASYAEPAVRPLRDLDILLAPRDALPARAVLLDCGFKSFPGDAAAALDTGYQLPALVDGSGRIIVELHHNLAAIEQYDAAPLAHYAMQTAQRVRLAGRPLSITGPKATFLHLALHAGAKSLFDCGPLVLADMAALLNRHREGLNQCRDLAERFGMLPSFTLATKLLARHGSANMPVGFTELPDVPAAMLDHAERLLVHPPADLRSRQMRRTAITLGRRKGIAAAARSALRPTPGSVAALSGGKAGRGSAWRHYPLWLWKRGAQYLIGFTNRSLRREARRDVALASFLHRGGDVGAFQD